MFMGIGFDHQHMVQWGGIKWDMTTEKRLLDKVFLEGHGYKVYSQNDEDGIIQEIFHRIGTTNKTFIEIGVQDGMECNTHYLLFLGWKGIWIEASEPYAKAIQRKFKYVVDNGLLKVINTFVTRENINELLSKEELPDEIDLLSIDIDGNDYYIFESISIVRPRVIVIEYNSKFPPDCSWCMPYCENYMWTGTDRHGASLKALEELANAKGYVLVGTNINGVNAFFVRTDLAKDLFPSPHTSENLYNPLRLNIAFKSGHPGDICLMNPTFKMEYDFGDTDEDYIATLGFHPKEIHDDGKTYHQWMSARKATAFLRINEKSHDMCTCTGIQIQYSAIDFEKYGYEKPELRVSVEGNARCYNYPVEHDGLITIPMDTPLTAGDVVKIDLEINHLWKPEYVLGTQDNRELGLAIHKIAPTGYS